MMQFRISLKAYGAADAENIIIAMGSVTETIRETIDYLTAQGKKVGLLVVHLYRPFSAKYFMNVLPKSVKRIAVLDRSKEPGANGEPLYLDVCELFYGKENAPLIVGGRFGLGSKDTTPAQIIGVYENLELNEPKNQFTIGIVDDVKTRLKLLVKQLTNIARLISPTTQKNQVDSLHHIFVLVMCQSVQPIW